MAGIHFPTAVLGLTSGGLETRKAAKLASMGSFGEALAGARAEKTSHGLTGTDQTVLSHRTKAIAAEWARATSAVGLGQTLTAEDVAPPTPTAPFGWPDFVASLPDPQVLQTDKDCVGFTWSDVQRQFLKEGSIYAPPESFGFSDGSDESFRRWFNNWQSQNLDVIQKPMQKQPMGVVELDMNPNKKDFPEADLLYRPQTHYEWPPRMILYSKMVQNERGEWVGVGEGLEINIEEGETLQEALARIAQPHREGAYQNLGSFDIMSGQRAPIFVRESYVETVARLVEQACAA
jgi:hypothetical protein